MCALNIGDEAPNFDLSSTEDALLMLRDEVPRTAVVLYFFTDLESERTRHDLAALGRQKEALARLRAKVLGISPAKMPQLKALQAELRLPFPLLRDDRNFSQAYGVEAPGDDETPSPALFVVDRQQRVVWMANPVGPVEEVMPQVLKDLRELPSPTAGYPKSIVNRLVDRWVN